MKETINYLKKLTSIVSPTGYTKEIGDYLVEEVEKLGYKAVRANKGGVNITVEGKDNTKHRVVTAHVDTLGAMVRAIKDDGRLKLAKVGGFPWNMIEGENCEVHIASNGKKVSGTILVHQTSTHVYKDAGTVERTEDNMEVRLDEKVTNAEETRALGIDVGDFISFDPRTIITETGFIKSRFLDDKVSAAILLDLLRKYKETNIQLPYTTHFMFSCFEEVGHGANSSIPEETVELANEKEIPYKLDIYPYYGSDASAAMSAGAEVKHALLGAGIESSHSYERTHLDSVEATHRMVDAYLQSDLLNFKDKNTDKWLMLIGILILEFCFFC